ncbi:NAD(P)/FAD-dependent oxidoreductase [Aquirufa sp. ROCK-SH2]
MKSNKKDFPVLIVGQGLAGTVLAHHLHRANLPFQIWDSPKTHFTSSMAAGGIFNPVTGRKLEETWLANELFDYLFPFYQQLEEELNDSFFHPMPLFRPFANAEMKKWLLDRKSEIDNAFLKWTDDGVWVEKTGWLDVAKLLSLSKDYFVKKGVFYSKEVIFDSIEFVEENASIQIGSECFSQIVFCEGFHCHHHNPYFGHLNFLPAKGELLRFKNKTLSSDYILNKNGFILPISKDEFKVGATYRWDDLSSLPHTNALPDLEKKLQQFQIDEYTALELISGVRPATQDRRPFVGFHPNLPVAIFNGFGSKGVSLIPYFAQQWLDEFQNKNMIHEEASIRRFYHLFSV